MLKMTCAHDVGRAVNPTLIEGQIEGGVAQGLGMALMEEFFPGRGENLHDYLIPTIGDMPPVESILIEDGSPVGPFGAKGIGEQALIPTAPAILNGHLPRDRDPPAAHSGDSPTACGAARLLARGRRARQEWLTPTWCAATPVPSPATSSRARPAPATATPTRTASWCGSIRWWCWSTRSRRARGCVPLGGGSADWDGEIVKSPTRFITAIGAGTTYPDYKPAPFIVSSKIDGVDTVTVVTEGIFSYCGVKVKIDTDRHLGPEQNLVRVDGEPVGHVTTGEYGSQMLSLGGVNHLTAWRKEGGPRHLRRAAAPLQRRGGGDDGRRRRHRDHPGG